MCHDILEYIFRPHFSEYIAARIYVSFVGNLWSKGNCANKKLFSYASDYIVAMLGLHNIIGTDMSSHTVSTNQMYNTIL